MNRDAVREAIAEVGYDLIDNFIAPAAGIESVVADLYLADVETYLEKEAIHSVMVNFLTKYAVDLGDNDFLIGYMEGWPIALIALYVLEHGNYLPTGTQTLL